MFQSFSGGAVHYTVSAEDGKNAKNYWLQVVKASDSPQLYINSLADDNANTYTDANGVIHSTREIMLDGYHDYLHDIFLANMSTAEIPALSAELVSDVVELDEYWRLNGTKGLSGFSTLEKDYTNAPNGELPNFAKIRIRAKEGTEATEVTGTLTIKSGSTTLVVLTLTGVIGDPSITTKEIPEAVKYVPYGTMIQNNNKYSWNQVSYWLIDGNLPAGMEVKQNGEIYGVPLETGEFTFTVQMENSYYDFKPSEKTYTLKVLENTDANVDGATDTGYFLTQRVQDVYLGPVSGGHQTMVSEGVYDEFVDIFLDGVKLGGGDYSSESGSTRITIYYQTLICSSSVGTHTLGIEFRTQDDKILKRAAQNYVVHDGASPKPGSNDSSSNNSDETFYTVNETAETVVYTVVAGDSLWKIAEKYYGSGSYWQKIYADNAGTISDPNKIYVGQQITIYLSGGSSAGTTNADGTSYTVASGDTLWKIAQRLYGKGRYWKKIYEANTNIIADPSRIYIGQVLILPED